MSREALYFNICIEEESKLIFNAKQHKPQKVDSDVFGPKAIWCLNRGKLIPDLQHLDSPQVKFCLIFVNSKVNCRKGVWGWLYLLSQVLIYGSKEIVHCNRSIFLMNSYRPILFDTINVAGL